MDYNTLSQQLQDCVMGSRMSDGLPIGQMTEHPEKIFEKLDRLTHNTFKVPIVKWSSLHIVTF